MGRKKKEEVVETKNMVIKEIVLDKYGEEVEVEGLASISKSIKESIVKVQGNELRFLVDNYYQIQKRRIVIASQVRAIDQGYDGEGVNTPTALKWILSNALNEEKQIKKMLDAYTNHDPVCKWAKSIIGIGPVISAAIVSYFDITKCEHYNQFHQYAGLNDNNIQWLGNVKAREIVKEVWEELGKSPSDKIVTYEVIAMISNKTSRTTTSIINGLKGEMKRSALESFLAKPPYNRDLKMLCWKIGESFCKVSNKEGSLYGRLYKERKAYETQKNINLAYADQAKKILKTKNIGKDTDAYKSYITGMLPPAHIDARSKRYAVKIFISHLFEAMYLDCYKKHAPNPYPLEYLGHVDYIKPENPYSDYINISSKYIYSTWTKYH